MRPYLKVPPLTCFSGIHPQHGEMLLDRHRAKDALREFLLDDDLCMVAHNTAFDMAVVCNEYPDLSPLVFAKYDKQLVVDTMLDEQLIDIAKGMFRFEEVEQEDEDGPHCTVKRKSYALGDLVGGLDKETHRHGYGRLRDVPLDQWSDGSRAYPLEDVRALVKLFSRQRYVVKPGEFWTPSAHLHTKAAFALHLMSAWGMRTDPESVQTLQTRLEKRHEELARGLLRLGLVRPGGSVNQSAVTEEIIASGVPFEKTPTGRVKTNSLTLQLAADGDPSHPLSYLLDYKQNQKLLGTFLPTILKGTVHPVMANYNPLVETGRTSCAKPNMQQLPRGDPKDSSDLAHKVRECFVPRKGFVYNFTDYDSLEIRTLGQTLQCMFGRSSLADKYKKDPMYDPHTNLAAQALGISYEEGLARKKSKDLDLANHRQNSKAGNFGYAGGMGYRKMTVYALQNYGIVMSETTAKLLKKNYLRAIPEMEPYFNFNDRVVKSGGVCEYFFSGMVRGGLSYPDACNGWFQHLAAWGAKQALWEVAKRCYVDRKSYLYGSRPVAFLHDEIGTEIPREVMHEASVEKKEIMERTMEQFATPDVPIRASPALCNKWIKAAEERYHNGRLIPHDEVLK